MIFFEILWTNEPFLSQKWGPKKWQRIMNHYFFSSSPIGKLFKNMDASHANEGPRVGLSSIEAGRTKLWIVFVCARFVSDRAICIDQATPRDSHRHRSPLLWGSKSTPTPNGCNCHPHPRQNGCNFDCFWDAVDFWEHGADR